MQDNVFATASSGGNGVLERSVASGMREKDDNAPWAMEMMIVCWEGAPACRGWQTGVHVIPECARRWRTRRKRFS